VKLVVESDVQLPSSGRMRSARAVMLTSAPPNAAIVETH
jgi:hypothetical protein